MAKVTVSLPQGTRDFGPEVVRKRAFILNSIRQVFELYGFQPLETPAMENLETLMGKYGEEGDKLIFKILNNGLNDPKNIDKAKAGFANVLEGRSSKDLTERALKYDLTIPFARYVAMNQAQLVFPFKRYQVQPVWRADRPQRGRYREFYQCDADVVGSESLLNEAELAGIYAESFARLGIAVEIKINSRKILAALAEKCGGLQRLTDITVAIDKLDKIGLEKVKEELRGKGLDGEAVAVIEEYLQITGTNAEKMASVERLLGNLPACQAGIGEINYVVSQTLLPKREAANVATELVIDLTLARGLNYYTGIIFEVKAKDAQMGSIGGGGRYDDLTGLFGVPGIPGVGISFGVDRIYDVMEELKLFPDGVYTGTQALFFNLGEQECRECAQLANQLRAVGIRCEVYPEASKFDKQFKYAERKNIPFVIIIGEKELAENRCNVKNLQTGVQESIALADLVNFPFS